MKELSTGIRILLTLILIHVSLFNYGQIDRGGLPRSFSDLSLNKSALPVSVIKEPDIQMLKLQDNEASKMEKGYRVGVQIPATLNMQNSGRFDALISGDRIWRIWIKCADAQGLGLIFSKLFLPAGADLFIYSADQKVHAGAFTSAEIKDYSSFIIRPLDGDEIIIEYFEPASCDKTPQLEIAGLVYMYRNFGTAAARGLKSEAVSGNCEVNIMCSEGDAWQKQKFGVVKILSKVGTNFYYCTGSMLNNTNSDFSNLLLTANHCSEDQGGRIATEADIMNWVFYFNYEASECINSTSVPADQTVVGAQVLSSSYNPNDMGSDFLLLHLKSSIPARFNPFYCGWDASSGISANGVCIHHPGGDVKKISTYKTPLTISTWGSTPNTHWVVNWATTENGHGVTEGGSSGGPLFDDEGLIIGTLTGGESDCYSNTGSDFFGRLPFSWKSNGATADKQLAPWLDPSETGQLKMPGSFNDKHAIADFTSETTIVPVGSFVNFQDLSAGKPLTWHWFFEGATPSQSTEQNPRHIAYNSFGAFKVKLIVSNDLNSDTIIKNDFIDVRAIVSPNPSGGTINVLAAKDNDQDIFIDVYNPLGMIASQFKFAHGSSVYTLNLPYSGNVFIIRITQGSQVQSHKVIVRH